MREGLDGANHHETIIENRAIAHPSVKGQCSFRSSPAVDIVPPSSAALKSQYSFEMSWQKDDIHAHPREASQAQKHLRPVEGELAVAQMRGSLSGRCHRI